MAAPEKSIYLSNIIILLHKSNHSFGHSQLFQIATLFALKSFLLIYQLVILYCTHNTLDGTIVFPYHHRALFYTSRY